MQIGIDLWTKHRLNLTKLDLVNEILSHTNDYSGIQRNNPGVAVVINWVDGGNLK